MDYFYGKYVKYTLKTFYVNFMSILCHFHVNFKLKGFPEFATIFLKISLNPPPSPFPTSLLNNVQKNAILLGDDFPYLPNVY